MTLVLVLVAVRGSGAKSGGNGRAGEQAEKVGSRRGREQGEVAVAEVAEPAEDFVDGQPPGSGAKRTGVTRGQAG